MKNKFLSCLGALLLLFSAQSWGGEKYVKGGYLYFDNSQTNWSAVRFATCQDDGNNGNGYLAFETMTKIENTNLYFLTNSKTKSYAGWKLTGFAFMRDDWENQDGKWSDKTKHMKDCYSGQKKGYTLNSEKYYYITCSGKGAEPDVSYRGTDYSSLNAKQTVVVLLSTDGGAHYYESDTWYGEINANRWTMKSSKDAVENTNKALSKSDDYASATLTSVITFSESNTAEGFTFQGWKTSKDGEIQTGNLAYNVSDDKTVYACFTGPDTNLPKVYFHNSLGWENVWVHFFAGEYWNSDKGTGVEGIYHSCIPMTKMEDSDLWYFAYPFEKKSGYIAFTSAEQKSYEFFYGCNAVYRGDFSSSKPVFVPCNGVSEAKNTVSDPHTNYYNKGYWKTLDEPYQYYLKNTWGTADKWSWKKMETTDGITYTLSDVGFTQGKGYNYNFLDDDCGKSTYDNDFTKVGVLETGDKVNITFTPSDNQITVTLIPTDLDVTIGSTGYATYFYSKPYIIPANVVAQYITAVDDRALTNTFLKEGDIIPAREGVILHAEPGIYTFEGTIEVPESFGNNLLQGTLNQSIVDNGNIHYILSLNEQDKVGLFWPYGTNEGVGSFTNGANKAYLEIPQGSFVARRIGYAFDCETVATSSLEIENQNTAIKQMIGGQLRIFRNRMVYNAQGTIIKR